MLNIVLEKVSTADLDEALPVPLLAALREAAAAGHPLVDVRAYSTEFGYELSVVPSPVPEPAVKASVSGGGQLGVMLALYPSAEQAQAIASDFSGDIDEPDELHVTLAYLGTGPFTDEEMVRVRRAGELAAAQLTTLTGQVAGYGRFAGEDQDPLWAALDVPGLASARELVVQMLAQCGLSVDAGHDWTPHMTLGWVDPAHPGKRPRKLAGQALTFDRLVVAVGSDRESFPLHAQPAAVEANAADLGYLKKDAPKRFTLAPWYIPDSVDAHGEWATPDDVQQALWGYVQSGDRSVRLQHNRDVSAGEWVEAVTWPVEVTLPMHRADGSASTETYPPGTVFLGVLWEPWSWQLVETGRVTGLSIGGRAMRVDQPGPGS